MPLDLHLEHLNNVLQACCKELYSGNEVAGQRGQVLWNRKRTLTSQTDLMLHLIKGNGGKLRGLTM